MAWPGIPGCTQKAAGGLAPAGRTRYGGERTERETPMGEAAFDTIAEVQRLRDVGLKQEQAEAITRSIHAGVTGGVATKADLERLETGLRSDMEKLETGLRSEISVIRNDLRWIKLTGGAVLAVLVLPWLAEVAGTALGN